MKIKYLFIFVPIIFISCSKTEEETPISGQLNFICADDIAPIIKLQVEDFTRLYPKAKVNQINTSARDAVVQLLNDSVEVIAIGRNFNPEELEVIKKNNFVIDSVKIAYEAIVAIVNTSNKISDIHVDDIKNILEGKKFSWSQIKGSKLQNKIVLALGDMNNGVNEYLRKRILNNKKIESITIKCNSTVDVISAVQKYENAIGFVGLNSITTKELNVKVLNVGDPNFYRDTVKKELEYFAPHQAHIYRNYYPLTRKIFILHNNVRYGVGVGFTTHVATNIGQHLFVKYSLVPAIMPVRLVQLSNEEN